jgi:hypothetical protein
MSNFTKLQYAIMDEIEACNLSFGAIAEKFNVSFEFVNDMAGELDRMYEELGLQAEAAEVDCEFDDYE